MALSVREQAALLGLLTGSSPLPMGSSSSSIGSPGREIEEQLRSLLGDPDFTREFMGRLTPEQAEALRRAGIIEGAESGYREGRRVSRERRAAARRAMEGGRRMRFGGKVAGKMAGGIGSKLLYGAGALGTALMAVDLLMMLKGAASDEGPSVARRGAGNEIADLLQAGQTPSTTQQLRRSQDLSRQALNYAPYQMGVSRDLQELVGAQQVRELARLRQRSKPGLQEAYARAGLLP